MVLQRRVRHARLAVVWVALAAGVLAALAPAAARADFGVQSFSATTLESDGTTLFTQAAGHQIGRASCRERV